jgi:hypothetical protein
MMHFDPEIHRELTRRDMSEERERVWRRRMAGPSRGGVAFRARMSRFLVGAAFAIDPEEGWRAFWNHLPRSESVARNPDT